jgi:hypothetical protein
MSQTFVPFARVPSACTYLLCVKIGDTVGDDPHAYGD